MGTPRLSRELAQQAVDAMSYAKALGKSGRSASRMLGLNNGTLIARLEVAKNLYGLEPVEAPPPAVEIISEPILRPRVRVKAATPDNPSPCYRIVAIGDTHQQPGMSTDRWRWLARFVLDEQPDKVVHMGDIGEFGSVSRHEQPGSLPQKLRPSFVADIESVEEGLAVYRKALGDSSIPHHIVLGNHEERIKTFESGSAELEGALWPMFSDVLARYDFRATDYRKYLGIGGVMFTHVPMTLREMPYNGKTLNPLANELTFSLCFAHTHRFGFLNIPKIGQDNRVQVLNVGSAMPDGFYPKHNKSEQGALTWGVVSMVIQAGNIISHRFVPMSELSRKYD